MLKRQLLAVLTLHDRPTLVIRVEREVVQVAEWVQHQASFPLDRKVSYILDRLLVPPKNVRFELRVRFARKFREALIPTAFINREDQVDRIGVLLVERFLEFACRAERGRPDTVLDRNLHRLQINTLHYEEASIFLVYRSLADFLLPLVQLGLVDRLIVVEAPFPVVLRSVLLMLVVVLMVTSADTLVVTAPIVIMVTIVVAVTLMTFCPRSSLSLPVIVVVAGSSSTTVIAH